MDTDVTLKFADGEYRFWLPLPQVFAFEREHGSILEFYSKLQASCGVNAEGKLFYLDGEGPSVKSMLDMARHALAGGNKGLVDGEEIEVGPLKAGELVKLNCFPLRPIEELAVLCAEVTGAAIRGVRVITTEKKSPTEPKKRRKSSPKEN